MTGEEFTCPCLEKCSRDAACNAVDMKGGTGPYLPSVFQLREYCTSREHKKCPLYFSASQGRGIDGLTDRTSKYKGGATCR